MEETLKVILFSWDSNVFSLFFAHFNLFGAILPRMLKSLTTQKTCL